MDFVWLWLLVFFIFFYFYPEELFGFAIETTIPLVPGEKKKKSFFIKPKQMAFLLVKNI